MALFLDFCVQLFVSFWDLLRRMTIVEGVSLGGFLVSLFILTILVRNALISAH